MNIIRAKTAGFCFGVDRAVKLTYDLLADGHKVALFHDNASFKISCCYFA